MQEQKKKRKCIDFYSCRTKTTLKKVMYINDTGQIHEDYISFREENLNGKRKVDILEKNRNAFTSIRNCTTVTNNTKKRGKETEVHKPD